MADIASEFAAMMRRLAYSYTKAPQGTRMPAKSDGLELPLRLDGAQS